MKKVNDKALEYAHQNEKPPFYDSAIRGYIKGYFQAQSDNPYRWRDPKKEKPDCVPGNFAFVLASIVIDGRNITEIVEYINDGGSSRWRVFNGDGCKDYPTEAVKAWMPKPYYIEDKI